MTLNDPDVDAVFTGAIKIVVTFKHHSYIVPKYSRRTSILTSSKRIQPWSSLTNTATDLLIDSDEQGPAPLETGEPTMSTSHVTKK